MFKRKNIVNDSGSTIGDASKLFISCNYASLGGGFKYFLFSPLLGENFQFDEHIFQMGGSTTN